MIDAPGNQLYALVSDLPRMGEWSPECTRVSWAGGATGAATTGSGRSAGSPKVRCSRRSPAAGSPIARWEYEFTPAATGGCTVAESWSDRRPTAMRLAFGWIFGDRNKRNAHGIRTTLANLKTAAESARQTH
ncbi:MAG: hypothetical protein QOH50_3024 [Kribbellaceae bacterium]|nr:hypothetical protein [Kribbellaceae bacterium]